MNNNNKKRILMVSANPWDTKALRLDQEHRAIKEVLRDSVNRDGYDINLLSAAQASDFQRELLEYKPHIVHFSGHGEKHALAFDAGNDTSQWIGNESLTGLFKSAAAYVECVIFNACLTESLAEAVGEFIDYVVGMDQPIDDEAAVHFSRGFYTGLFAGQFYTAAFDQGIYAVQMKGLPDHLTPQLKIRTEARRISFVPACGTDILILCPDSQTAWAKKIQTQLDDLISQRFGSRNTFSLARVTDADENVPDRVTQAGLLLPVFSSSFWDSPVCEQALTAFMDAAGTPDRVFPLKTDAVMCPDNFQTILSYPFWKTGGEILTPADARFHASLDMLVHEITDRLQRLKTEIEHRMRMKAELKKSAPPSEPVDLPPAFLFVNAAPEDRELLEEITGFLKANEAEYSQPLPLSANPTPEEMRRDLELNLETCDLYMVIYGQTRMPWVREQVLYSRRVWRRCKQELKVVAVLNDDRCGPKDELNLTMKNVRIFKCSPDKISEYLPKCMGDACHE